MQQTLTIAQASATVTLGNLTQTYDGNAKAASATTNPSSLTVTFTYNGSATAPTDAGSYSVVGTINDANYQGTASGTLTINPAGTVATPAFSPAAGTYIGAQSVTISCATSGATIYYTTDGSAPSTSAAQYSAAINVSTTTTIKAYAVKSGWIDSAVASATYTVYVPASGGSGAPTPNTGVTATNPVDGTSVTVASHDGGVVQLQVGDKRRSCPRRQYRHHDITDATGNVVATVQGTQPGLPVHRPGDVCGSRQQ